MDTGTLTARQLAPLIESKPVVTICLSGRDELYNTFKENGISAALKSLRFRYDDWADGMVAEEAVPDEEIDATTGFHVVRKPGGLLSTARPIEEDEIDVFLAMLLNQHKDMFALNKNNHFIVFQDTVHTGKSLEAMRKAILLNGIPKSKVVTAAFKSSISPVFPPDVIGGRAVLRPPKQKKDRQWIRVDHRGRGFVLNVPMP